METIKIKIIQIDNGLALPEYQTEQAAGVDLLAALPPEGFMLAAGEYAMISTGIAIALPDGYEAQVRPRSGLAAKHGIGLVNSPGTIDADYRGEIKVIMINWSKQDFLIERGMRIAQLVFAPLVRGEFIPCLQLDDTKRGTGGFGHTGV